jgi:hypothetical protein
MAKVPTPPTRGERSADETGEARPDRALQSSVLAALGRPPGLYQVAVRRLWENRFRVNVLVGPDYTSARIAHSFFVETDASGHIHSSTPRITKLYT